MLKYALIPFLPLTAFVINGLLGRWIKNRAHWPAILWLAAFLPYLTALNLFAGAQTISLIERFRRITDRGVLLFFIACIVFGTVVYPMLGRAPGRPFLPALTAIVVQLLPAFA